MNILYIGAGFVGACSAAVSGNSGHNTLVFDINEERIKMLNSGDRDTIEACLFEKGLGDLLVRHSGLINFTTDYSKVESFLEKADAVFMCLPTPEIDGTGESDLKYYNIAAEKLAEAMKKRNNGTQDKYIVIVNKSTVPINMMDQTKNIFDAAGVKNYGVVSNPEFLVEGKAVQGAMKPDRVVVGANEEKEFEVMRNIYQRFYEAPDVSFLEVNPKEAAAGKLLSNFYLFHKLMACFDVIGRTCETFEDLRFEKVRKIIMSDKRIGGWGFYNSLYAGGSCLIKDARSLSHQLQLHGKSAALVDEVYFANKRQLEMFLGRAKSEADFDWQGKKVALIGGAFKRDTNDIRNAPSIDIINFLKEQQVSKISINDPAAMDNLKKVHPESETIEYVSHEFDTTKDADVIILATDWPQFRGLADSIVEELTKRPLIMDGRRMLQHRYADLQRAGFDIISVGSPFIKGKK